MSEWLLCCSNIKSHMENRSRIFVIERHQDSGNIIWMSDFGEKLEDIQMILQLSATNIWDQNMFPTCEFQGWQSIDRLGKPGFSPAGQYSQKWQYWAILGNEIFSPRFHYEIL